ncbi:MAG: YidH family protein [Microcoleaceae cyanobacterium]|jgi:putative membrane protein
MSESPKPVNLNNELAKERNRAAAERTLMAWIRTSLSLISFGFGIDKILEVLRQSKLKESTHIYSGARLVCIGFILIGIFALWGAIRQHRKILKLIQRDDYVYTNQASIAMTTAISVILVGIFGLIVVLAGL